MEEKRLTEQRVLNYLNTLSLKLKEIEGITSDNYKFTEIQKTYVDTFASCIEKGEKRLKEISDGAVWDNLVIAFFGETNAGKSTIIETFRILFEESERKQDMETYQGGVDGLIVGTGESDYTQVYKEYKMNIGGVPFTLIDVPGIEGNEAKYEEEIRMALNKAHYVFYVHGMNKKPDEGTATKIKKYLRNWVKVYSIYNVRGIPSDYEEAKERRRLLTRSKRKIEAQTKRVFRRVLGETYVGNISLQGHLALCANAQFSEKRVDLQRGQDKLFQYFGSKEKIFKFSLFQSLIKIVKKKARDYVKEIVEANKERHKALLRTLYYELDDTSNQKQKEIDELKEIIKTFKNGVIQDFADCKTNINSLLLSKYNAMFTSIREKVYFAIDKKLKKEKEYNEILESEVKKTSRVMAECVSKQLELLNENIKKREEQLSHKILSVTVKSETTLNFTIDLKDAIDKLRINFSDITHLLSSNLSMLFIVLNSWNPVGWIALGLNAMGVIFGRRDRKGEAKEEVRVVLSKAKSENRDKIKEIILSIQNTLDDECRNIMASVNDAALALRRISKLLNDTKGSLKEEYWHLKRLKYGKI